MSSDDDVAARRGDDDVAARRGDADGARTGDAVAPPHRVECTLGAVLEARDMTLTELSARTGITLANLSILKTGKARAIRFTTLTAICEALDCTPADLFRLRNAAR